MRWKEIFFFLTVLCGFISGRTFAQSYTVQGRIISSTEKNGIAGATITEKGTTGGVTSDSNGVFKIQLKGPNAILVITYVGYAPQEISVAGRTSVDVTLTISGNNLGDVVVIGYGSVKRKDLTGSVTQVKAKELTAYPTGNALQSLNGRAAGVRVVQNDGTPGATPSLRIRGVNSILGSNEPLYVIDGFPGTANNLQSSDIETIDILKDASATAIYGSRGANGVVIITTKKGKSGKTQVDYEGSYGIQSATKKLKLMNNTQWAEFYNEQANNDGLTPYFTTAQVDSIGQSPSTNWQDQVLQNAGVLHQYISVTGGNEKTQFSASGNVFMQDGIIRNSGYDLYTLHATISHTISKIFNFSVNTLLSKANTSTVPTGIGGSRGSGMLGAMIDASPALAARNPDGSIKRLNTVYPWLSNSLINPLTVTDGQTNNTINNQQLANLALNIKPVDGLTIRLTGGIQNQDIRNDFFQLIDPNINSTGSASVGTTQLTSLLSENTATYEKTFGDHTISAVGGFSYQQDLMTTLNASGSGFLSNVESTYDLQGAATQGIASSSYSKSNLISYLGRINYAYKGRYLATVSWRRDGSSKFSEGNKWADFPSAALAWLISEEKFMQPVRFISNLKLRTSYGATGNNALSPYQTLNMLTSRKVVFNDALYSAYGPGTSKPGKLKWETTDEYDAGLDVGFFNNRLNFTIDYYYKRTKDLLNTVQLPASTGYVNTLQNIGAIENKGWEFTVDGLIVDKAVKWTASANISFNKNKVLSLYGGQDIFGSPFFTGPVNDYVNLIRVGQPLGIFYGYKEDGYTATGNIKYKDLNGDSVINANDKTYIGNPNPKFIYGFNTSVSYKGFNLSVFIQGTEGNDIFNLNATQTIDLGFGLNQPEDEFYNHWTPSNTNAKYPKVTKSISGNISDRFVEDGSYMRFKNIELGYTLPPSAVKWSRSLQIYVSGQNLITITHYSWFDPEVNALGSGNSINLGIDYYGYPTAKTITFGVRCGF